MWKTPDQKPTSGKWICIFDGFDYQFDKANPDCWDGMFVEKWCDFHDLIAQADKAERLQKAVDLAVHSFNEICAGVPSDIWVFDEATKATNEIKQMIKE